MATLGKILAGSGILAAAAFGVLFGLNALGDAATRHAKETTSAPLPAPTSVSMTRAAYGESWPFVVEGGRVECRDHREVVFVPGDGPLKGRSFALNGQAMSSGKWFDSEEIRRVNEAVLAMTGPDPRYTPLVDVTPVIAEGLKLCRDAG